MWEAVRAVAVRQHDMRLRQQVMRVNRTSRCDCDSSANYSATERRSARNRSTNSRKVHFLVCFLNGRIHAVHKAWRLIFDGNSTNCNCNCNWGTCIAPPILEDWGSIGVNPYPDDRKPNQTEMFSDHDEESPSIAAVSAPSAACFVLAVQQQKKLCRRFVDVSAARQGYHKTRGVVYCRSWQLMSEGPRYIPACVPEATCEPASTTCILDPLSRTGNQCNSNSWRAGITRSRGLRSRKVRFELFCTALTGTILPMDTRSKIWAILS